VQNAFDAFVAWYSVYGYPVLFLGVLLENAGVPVPGETAVLGAAFLASPEGGGRFHLGWVIALTSVAAVLGDNAGYWLGRRLARPRLNAGRGFLILTPERFRMVEAYFTRYGTGTVFAARFVAGLRVVAAPAAGAAGMHWPSFFLANAAGALAWATAVGLLGYFCGRSWGVVHHWVSHGTWLLVVVLALAWLLRYLWRRRAGGTG
jgi:membrane-associated protein